ncbi:MAG: hypothetical protein DMF54_13565 [Acidobacteria bacterium]|nr:MAG: hypothetical protein DMF55_06840 [Acidobacteriota bacterium]PYQ64660.1 MAG: hypothetical protein DMF54_13565 [Acidobacteriota bacterium]
MVRRSTLFALLLVAGLLLAAGARGMTAKTYQVTGPVLEVSNDMIAVQKGKDRWEIARDPSSKVPANLKVGDKVTIEYRMTATSVEVKPAAASKKKK